MALLDDVNSELATINDDLPAAMVAQAAAMFQFGGGLRQTRAMFFTSAQAPSEDGQVSS